MEPKDILAGIASVREVALSILKLLDPADVSSFLCTSRSTAALASAAWRDKLSGHAAGSEDVGQRPLELRLAVAAQLGRRRLRAIAFGKGWAVHAVVLKFQDGSLKGTILKYRHCAD